MKKTKYNRKGGEDRVTDFIKTDVSYMNSQYTPMQIETFEDRLAVDTYPLSQEQLDIFFTHVVLFPSRHLYSSHSSK